MRDALSRLRAALTPQTLLLLLSLLLLAGSLSPRAHGSQTALEARIAQTLSAMEGAGEVNVVIRTQAGVNGEVACSAVAVAQGADDLRVRLSLEQAVRTLMGIEADRVEILVMREDDG